MLLPFHIAIALASLIFSTYLFFSPSIGKLRLSYGLVGLTLASGTFLAARPGVHIAQLCTTGLLYLGGVSIGIVRAHYRVARAKVKLHD